MRMNPKCVPCLIGRVLFEAEEIDPSKSHEAVKLAAEMLGELFAEGSCSATVATQVHREIYRLLGDEDPYARLKRMSNEVALDLYPSAQQFVERSDDRLRDAFLSSIVGNVLDFGIGTGYDDPEKLRREFTNLLSEGLGHDDTPAIRRILKGASKVVYLVDNCGEVVFDRLALRELRELGVDLTLVLKERPILTDATIRDIEGLGMEELVDRVVEAPGFAVGVDLVSLSGPFGELLRGADLVIAKGMANFEALSETDIEPIAYLLRTKCAPVAEAMSLRKDISAVKLFPGERVA